MTLVPTDQLATPTFSSILLCGPPKCGKTASIATLHKVLRKRKLPTKIAFFDMDEDGAEPLLRLARSGYESVADALASRNRIDPWQSDIELHRFNLQGLRMRDAAQPKRTEEPAHAFINELNEYFDRLDSRTGTFKDKSIGAIVVDSITGLTDIFEDFVFSFRGREIGEEGQRAISFNDWRLLAEKVMEAYKSCKSLPCYSVFTTHVETRQEVIRGPSNQGTNQDMPTHQLYDVPLVTGQLRERIAKDFGVVLYTLNNWKWRTRPGGSDGAGRIRSAGSRGVNSLPTEIDQDFALVLDV